MYSAYLLTCWAHSAMFRGGHGRGRGRMRVEGYRVLPALHNARGAMWRRVAAGRINRHGGRRWALRSNRRRLPVTTSYEGRIPGAFLAAKARACRARKVTGLPAGGVPSPFSGTLRATNSYNVIFCCLCLSY